MPILLDQLTREGHSQDAVAAAATALKRQQLNSLLGRRAVQVAAGSAGIGAGLIGVQALYKQLQRIAEAKKPKPNDSDPIVIHRVKHSELPIPFSWAGDALTGRNADSLRDYAPTAPVLTAAAGLGLGGGIYAANTVAKRLRQRAIAAQVAQARDEFEQLIGNVPEGVAPEQPQAKLSKLWAEFEKHASSLGLTKGAEAADMAANLMGIYGAAILAASALAAGRGWSNAQKKSPRRRYDMAALEVARQRRAVSPTQPVAVLEEVDSPPESAGMAS